jgi:hypothetical protein
MLGTDHCSSEFRHLLITLVLHSHITFLSMFIAKTDRPIHYTPGKIRGSSIKQAVPVEGHS